MRLMRHNEATKQLVQKVMIIFVNTFMVNMNILLYAEILNGLFLLTRLVYLKYVCSYLYIIMYNIIYLYNCTAICDHGQRSSQRSSSSVDKGPVSQESTC